MEPRKSATPFNLLRDTMSALQGKREALEQAIYSEKAFDEVTITAFKQSKKSDGSFTIHAGDSLLINNAKALINLLNSLEQLSPTLLTPLAEYVEANGFWESTKTYWKMLYKGVRHHHHGCQFLNDNKILQYYFNELLNQLYALPDLGSQFKPLIDTMKETVQEKLGPFFNKQPTMTTPDQELSNAFPTSAISQIAANVQQIEFLMTDYIQRHQLPESTLQQFMTAIDSLVKFKSALEKIDSIMNQEEKFIGMIKLIKKAFKDLGQSIILLTSIDASQLKHAGGQSILDFMREVVLKMQPFLAVTSRYLEISELTLGLKDNTLQNQLSSTCHHYEKLAETLGLSLSPQQTYPYWGERLTVIREQLAIKKTQHHALLAAQKKLTRGNVSIHTPMKKLVKLLALLKSIKAPEAAFYADAVTELIQKKSGIDALNKQISQLEEDSLKANTPVSQLRALYLERQTRQEQINLLMDSEHDNNDWLPLTPADNIPDALHSAALRSVNELIHGNATSIDKMLEKADQAYQPLAGSDTSFASPASIHTLTTQLTQKKSDLERLKHNMQMAQPVSYVAAFTSTIRNYLFKQANPVEQLTFEIRQLEEELRQQRLTAYEIKLVAKPAPVAAPSKVESDKQLIERLSNERKGFLVIQSETARKKILDLCQPYFQRPLDSNQIQLQDGHLTNYVKSAIQTLYHLEALLCSIQDEIRPIVAIEKLASIDALIKIGLALNHIPSLKEKIAALQSSIGDFIYYHHHITNGLPGKLTATTLLIASELNNIVFPLLQSYQNSLALPGIEGIHDQLRQAVSSLADSHSELPTAPKADNALEYTAIKRGISDIYQDIHTLLADKIGLSENSNVLMTKLLHKSLPMFSRGLVNVAQHDRLKGYKRIAVNAYKIMSIYQKLGKLELSQILEQGQTLETFFTQANQLLSAVVANLIFAAENNRMVMRPWIDTVKETCQRFEALAKTCGITLTSQYPYLEERRALIAAEIDDLNLQITSINHLTDLDTPIPVPAFNELVASLDLPPSATRSKQANDESMRELLGNTRMAYLNKINELQTRTLAAEPEPAAEPVTLSSKVIRVSVDPIDKATMAMHLRSERIRQTAYLLAGINNADFSNIAHYDVNKLMSQCLRSAPSLRFTVNPKQSEHENAANLAATIIANTSRIGRFFRRLLGKPNATDKLLAVAIHFSKEKHCGHYKQSDAINSMMQQLSANSDTSQTVERTQESPKSPVRYSLTLDTPRAAANDANMNRVRRNKTSGRSQ